MKTKTIYVILLLFLFFPNIIIAQSNNEDSNSNSMPDLLDSLLLSWFYYTSRDTLSNSNNNQYVDVSDSIFEHRIQQIITPIELSYNKNVQKYLDKYVKRGRWSAPKFLGLSHQYFPLFEERLDAYDIPLELKYLPIIESALNPRAKSPAGATGLWQFMYKTGLMMGLEINSYVDERMDPYKSTDAACKFLKSLYDTYGNWTIALAAYNAGPGTINNALRRCKNANSFWDLYPYLPFETKNYVPGFIAIVYLFNYYEHHGYKADNIQFYDDVDTVMVKRELHFAQLDSVLGIPINQTRELNPQYKIDIIPAKIKSYPLRLRRQYITKFIELEDSIYNYKDTLFFNPKKYNYKPDEKFVDNIPCKAQPKGTTALTYIVKSGDVLGAIAKLYNVSVNDLKAWNGIYTNKINIGQNLTVYVPVGQENKYKNNNKSNKEKTPIKEKTNVKTDANYEYYTVKSGDSPYIISKKYENVTPEDIMNLNGISNPSGLKVGQKLKIKKIN